MGIPLLSVIEVGRSPLSSPPTGAPPHALASIHSKLAAGGELQGRGPNTWSVVGQLPEPTAVSPDRIAALVLQRWRCRRSGLGEGSRAMDCTLAARPLGAAAGRRPGTGLDFPADPLGDVDHVVVDQHRLLGAIV